MLNRREFLARAAVAVAAPSLAAATRAPTATQSPSESFDPWLEIDRGALASNARAVATLAGGRPIIAVVKNNAYGTGLETAGPILDALAEVRMLAVVRPEEALTLRRAGVKKPLLLMGPASEAEVTELLLKDVVQSLATEEALVVYSRVSRRLSRPIPVHLYVDTGMHRMGMPVDRALAVIDDLLHGAGPPLRIEGAFTELTEDADFDRVQAQGLRELHAKARAHGSDFLQLHAASSDAIQHGTTEALLDAVRPGLALYGGYVSDRARARADLRPAYSLKARVIRVDRLEAGDGVSYHRRWKADKPTWTATLAVGHVDGYPSGAVKGCEVLVRDRLFPVIGNVSASHTILDLGDTQAVQVGDVATLVGPQNPALHPNEVAKRAGYSEYDMFMHLSPKLRRQVVG